MTFTRRHANCPTAIVERALTVVGDPTWQASRWWQTEFRTYQYLGSGDDMHPRPVEMPYVTEILGSGALTNLALWMLRQIPAETTNLYSFRISVTPPNRQLTPHKDFLSSGHYYQPGRKALCLALRNEPGSIFTVDDVPIEMSAGECWRFDPYAIHSVDNGSSASRVAAVLIYWERGSKKGDWPIYPPIGDWIEEYPLVPDGVEPWRGRRAAASGLRAVAA